MKKIPCLYIIVPCYNEEQVLPITSKQFLKKLNDLIACQKISEESRVMFVNDGSKDKTWDIIQELSRQDCHYIGIAQSRNRGHQNALLAGLMEAKNQCDITISIDCDGQDDINAMDEMVDAYWDGCEIVYGVRSKRDTDTFFKRFTAEGFYKLLNWMGAEVVYNHADYRLISSRVLQEFADFKEVNIFLRGMVPLVGFKSTSVYYERSERIAGESHYPLRKMLALAFDGITSLSVKPIRMITAFGMLIAGLSFIGIIWAVVGSILGKTVAGWASTICIICFMGGIQLLSLGVIGEYIGKIYLETKARPRYIISERTYDKDIDDIAVDEKGIDAKDFDTKDMAEDTDERIQHK
ncbi:MAG: glycosyltransferase family 2 protein [Lachnospiraceae bacterium]|nr:glycosyltransferase family 2 protein [Lachnospiraceae bacterium]